MEPLKMDRVDLKATDSEGNEYDFSEVEEIDIQPPLVIFKRYGGKFVGAVKLESLISIEEA